MRPKPLTGNSRRTAFRTGLLPLILSTLTGDHDSQGHRGSENHCCNGLHYGRRDRSLQPLLRDILECLA
jgi:hypothetical protein